MRALRLARLAARAEGFRLRLLVRRQAWRAALGLVAAVFVLAALVGLHVAGVLALTAAFAPLWAVLIVVGVDVFIAVVLAAIALRSRPGEAEREALQLRRVAVEQAMEAEPMARLFVRGRKAGSFPEVIAAALAAWLAGARR